MIELLAGQRPDRSQTPRNVSLHKLRSPGKGSDLPLPDKYMHIFIISKHVLPSLFLMYCEIE